MENNFAKKVSVILSLFAFVFVLTFLLNSQSKSNLAATGSTAATQQTSDNQKLQNYLKDFSECVNKNGQINESCKDYCGLTIAYNEKRDNSTSKKYTVCVFEGSPLTYAMKEVAKKCNMNIQSNGQGDKDKMTVYVVWKMAKCDTKKPDYNLSELRNYANAVFKNDDTQRNLCLGAINMLGVLMNHYAASANSYIKPKHSNINCNTQAAIRCSQQAAQGKKGTKQQYTCVSKFVESGPGAGAGSPDNTPGNTPDDTPPSYGPPNNSSSGDSPFQRGFVQGFGQGTGQGLAQMLSNLLSRIFGLSRNERPQRQQPKPRPTCLLLPSKTVVSKGETITLKWSVKNATSHSLDIDPSLKAEKKVISKSSTQDSAQESLELKINGDSGNITLQATGAGGNCTKTILIRVSDTTTTDDRTYFTCSPQTLNQVGNTDVNLSWSCPNASNKAIIKAYQNTSDTPLILEDNASSTGTTTCTTDKDTMFELICFKTTSATSTKTPISSKTCSVSKDELLFELLAQPTEAKEGETIRLSWASIGASSCTIEGPHNFKYSAKNASAVVEPFPENDDTREYVYTLTCTTPSGISRTKDVKIKQIQD